MNLFAVAWRGLRYRSLHSFLSLLLLSFGLGLIMVVVQSRDQLERSFSGQLSGIDMVVGAKGSPLQLILSSVYHLDAPTGNIPLQEFQDLSRSRHVDQAIPLSYGDNYQGFRIVGSHSSYLDLYDARLATGQMYEQPFQAVLGAQVAQQRKLEIGDQFHSNHGLQTEGSKQHEEQPYQVVGILEPGAGVLDDLILTSLSSIWDMHEHAAPDKSSPQDTALAKTPTKKHSKEEHREITAGLITFDGPMAMMSLPRHINKNTSMQAALPSIEMNRLYSLADDGIRFLQALGLLLIAVAAISVFTALLQSLKDDEGPLAFLRAIGAGPASIVGLMISKSLLLCLGGYAGALLVSQLALGGINFQLSDTYAMQPLQALLHPVNLYLLAGVIITALLAALLPARRAYRLSITETLAHA